MEALIKLLLALILSLNMVNASAQARYTVDSNENPLNYGEASENALPAKLYQDLMKQISLFQFTLMEEIDVEELFQNLKKDSRARTKDPEGACAERRYYVQQLLKKTRVTSGQFLITCPHNDGQLRLKDRVSGRNYTYSNFHDVNIVAIKTGHGFEFRVLDFQFEDNPVSLEDYIGEVESTQKKIYPSKTKGREAARGACYWSISTDFLTY